MNNTSASNQMTVTPAISDLARQILATERDRQNSEDTPAATAASVFDRLRRHLTIFVGAAGYVAVLSRALALASNEDPWLRETRLLPDGTLDLGASENEHRVEAGMTVLLAQLLGLIDVLVGAGLMLRLVQDIWPTVALDLSLDTQPNIAEVTA